MKIKNKRNIKQIYQKKNQTLNYQKKKKKKRNPSLYIKPKHFI